MMHSKLLTAILVIAVILASFWLGTVWDGTTPSGVKPAGTSKAGTDPSIGPENAQVTIFEYSDFQCPYCSRVGPSLDKIKTEYKDTVKIVFKNYPLSFHAQAQKAAEAGECANLQGKFWEMHDKMFANQNALGIDALKRYASEIGLNTDKFNECLDSGSMASEVERDFQEGVTAGVQGTPAFIIEGEIVSGAQPFEKFKEVIDRKLSA